MMKNDIIAYSVNKTNNRGLYISVQNGEVSVRAPWYATKEKIQYGISVPPISQIKISSKDKKKSSGKKKKHP